MSNFSTDQGASTEQPTDQLTFTVGERQYDAEAAATKISNADAHIAKLEQEAVEHRDNLAAAKLELASTTSVQEALTQLQNPVTPQENLASDTTSPLTKEQIGELAKEQLTVMMSEQATATAKATAEASELSTFNDTKAKIVAQYGDKTEQIMNDKATAMGVPIDRLITMASDPITAGLLLESMKVSKVAPQASPSGSVNTSSFTSSAPEDNTGWYKGSSKAIMQELTKRLNS